MWREPGASIRRGLIMRGYKIISPLVVVGVLAASVSTAAFADDYHNRGHGNGAVIAAGILGAVIVGSLIANSQPSYAPAPVYVQPEPQPYPYYEAPPQAYYPPQPVYYQPQPVYYQPQPQYYGPQPGVYIEGGYRYRR
jgi:hypothetical protein